MIRHICCKCGRKRLARYVRQNNSCFSFTYLFEYNWRNYPRLDSYKCIVDCLPYFKNVHVTAGIKNNCL